MVTRFPLAVLPTPLTRAHRLEAALGRGPVWVKRDDLTGFGTAGNKSRPLEYLIGDALARDCDVLVTGGGPGSNFVPAAALAARAAGLDCELVVWGDPAGAPNMALARAAGARLLPTGDADRAAVDGKVAARAAELVDQGRRPYPVPRGGSTPVGAIGFAVAAAELVEQLRPHPRPAVVALSVGSGGSCAGLLAGLAAAGVDWPVLGAAVSRPPAEIGPRLAELAAGCAELLGRPAPATDRLELVDARGPGFGIATDAERERARLALTTEGLLLDDTYGAPAFSVLIDRLLEALPRVDGPVVYWHTGGVVSAIRERGSVPSSARKGQD
jgi:1-aminocyclopropane-1-carboxylate deaminase/D-cysteine desulfhydrase-like pyridoxal-dependent ACC family enzyme